MRQQFSKLNIMISLQIMQPVSNLILSSLLLPGFEAGTMVMVVLLRAEDRGELLLCRRRGLKINASQTCVGMYIIFLLTRIPTTPMEAHTDLGLFMEWPIQIQLVKN